MSASLLKGVVEYLTPVLHSSAYASTGVLTPAEFTSSGDQLVHSSRHVGVGGRAGGHGQGLPAARQAVPHHTQRPLHVQSERIRHAGDPHTHLTPPHLTSLSSSTPAATLLLVEAGGL